MQIFSVYYSFYKSSVDVQLYHCLFFANIAMLFMFKPKSEVVFGSAEVKP